jgi:adenine-specific DNA-methyltransferase
MSLKQRALKVLTKDELHALGKRFELEITRNMSADDMVRVIAGSKRATLEKILPSLKADTLRLMGEVLGAKPDGRSKQELLDSLLATVGGAPQETESQGPQDGSAAYEHKEEALARPDVGTQPQFKKKRPAKTYRYDSSLSPALDWDRKAAREKGEELIASILKADTLKEAKAAASQLKAMSRPFLNWAGKAERLSFEVPTLPLFVHERLSTEAIIATLTGHKREKQIDLFGGPSHPIAEQVLKAYEYKDRWVNRMILGDSMVVMNSLLQYEGLGGQVQMIYMDPPYGVKFGSNFQPFVRKRDVSNGDDDDMTREPEMVQAYRDTWELGLHSYLTYMRDRLLLARDLLAPSGSIFVQISDENVHRIRLLLDETFGPENFCAQIAFAKTTSATSKLIASTTDQILWYARDRERVKYRPLYLPKTLGGDAAEQYSFVQLPDGERRRMTREERVDPSRLPLGSRVFRCDNLTSPHPPGNFEVPFDGRQFRPGGGQYWKTGEEGMHRLVAAKRLHALGNTLCYVRFIDDFPAYPLDANWTDTVNSGFGEGRLYVVQTNVKVLQRCLIMTTDPGDLVLDPTCGSGTTAFVAEQTGRRWITTDVSRVPLALARQRLLTATYPWFALKDDPRGPAGGFTYKRRQNARGEEVGGIVPHVTLKSIAKNEPPAEEVLVDRPEEVKGITRVSDPFAFEATIPTPQDHEQQEKQPDGSFADRLLEVLRKSPILHLEGGKKVEFKNVRQPAKTLSLSAEAHLKETGELVAFAFGPENGPVSEQLVYNAGREAYAKGYGWLYVIGFAVEPNARKLVEESERAAGISTTYVQASPDLLMGDLLKNMRSSQIFSVCGLPDVAVRKEKGKHVVELRGVDVFDPVEMKSSSRTGNDVPAWFLDTNYNGLSFYVCQAFFPRTQAWDSLKKALKSDYDEAVFNHLAGNVSAPFEAGDKNLIAVKVIDDRGNELLVVKPL